MKKSQVTSRENPLPVTFLQLQGFIHLIYHRTHYLTYGPADFRMDICIYTRVCIHMYPYAFLFFFNCIEAWLIYNVVLISAVQQVTQLHIYLYSFSYSFPLVYQDIKYSSLCYRVRPCCLFILYILAFIC